MKKVSVLAATLFALAAGPVLANCPDLSGEWQCKDSYGDVYGLTMYVEGTTMITSDEDGTTELVLDGMDRQADGLNYNGRCRGNQIILRVWGKDIDETTGQELDLALTASMTAAADLRSYKINSSYTVTDSKGEVLDKGSNQETCAKVN